MARDDVSAYESLVEHNDARWAFGSDFDDPLAGVHTTVPPGVDGRDLAAYCLMLGDDALILSHRLQQWVTRLPELEEEVAVANIALDLLGQARFLLARAGAADGSGRDEDRLAFFRDEHEFRNVRLVELPRGDFACEMARILLASTWRLAQFERLRASRDPVLAAIAAKAVNELAYHRDYAAGWVVRLGDGTPLSHERMQAGLEAVWPYLDELFAITDVEERLVDVGVAVDPRLLRDEVEAVLDEVLRTATLARPEVLPRPGVRGRSGRDGVHTEALGYLLAELQSIARAHPQGVW
ncbi:MAG TPA: 1,2-phenylacetyl-CoA epoxidase subunit PaaC [Egibacteraceae bacterium]